MENEASVAQSPDNADASPNGDLEFGERAGAVIRRCTHCGVEQTTAKRPVGWRAAITPCGEMLTHTCSECAAQGTNAGTVGVPAAAKPFAGTRRWAEAKADATEPSGQESLF